MKSSLLILVSLTSFLALGWAALIETNLENATSGSLPHHNQRIFGGVEASLGSWPYQGIYTTTKGSLCGCSLISRRWAITATHCTSGTEARKMSLIFGTINRVFASSATQVFSVDKKIEHPGYDSTSLRNDITLLFMDKEADLTTFVQPIAIPPQGIDVSVGKTCIITGWGTTETDPDSNPTTLMQAEVPVISNRVCQIWLRSTGVDIVDEYLCAGFESGGVDTCAGDSGGPLACYNEESSKYYLQGITSFGYGCAQPRRPGIYTRVSEFSEWIRENAGVASANILTSSTIFKTTLMCFLGFLTAMSLSE